MKLVQEVERAVRHQNLLEPGMRVAVACSGGADSVALLLLLDELKERLGLRLLVAHLNHQLRGAESDADEGFVRQLAERLGLECVVQREDVAARQKKSASVYGIASGNDPDPPWPGDRPHQHHRRQA